MALDGGLGSLDPVGHGRVGKDVVVVGRIDDQTILNNRHLCPRWVRIANVVAGDHVVAAVGRASIRIWAIDNIGAVGGFGTVEDTEGPGA